MTKLGTPEDSPDGEEPPTRRESVRLRSLSENHPRPSHLRRLDLQDGPGRFDEEAILGLSKCLADLFAALKKRLARRG